MNPYHYELLITLLTQPTAPFREQHVAAPCEGTVATVYGVPTIALVVPLGNDRNQRLQGDPIAVA